MQKNSGKLRTLDPVLLLIDQMFCLIIFELLNGFKNCPLYDLHILWQGFSVRHIDIFMPFDTSFILQVHIILNSSFQWILGTTSNI